MRREDVQRDVSAILRWLGVIQKPTVATLPARAWPPVFHCHWCAAPLKRRAFACQGHADVERIWQERHACTSSREVATMASANGVGALSGGFS